MRGGRDKTALLIPIVAILLTACTVGQHPATPAPSAAPTLGTVTAATGRASSIPSTSAACPVTPFITSRPPDANTARFTETWYGNDVLWAGLAPPYQGKWFASSLKVLWWRSVSGTLTIEGTRLDGNAPPVTAFIPDGYGQTGYQATGIDIPTPGCWAITGKVANQELRFVVAVSPAGCLPENLRVQVSPSPPPCTAARS
ncbi:MAG: hypothetical protein ACYDAR_13465 [Thermomicrobiales bacterium]